MPRWLRWTLAVPLLCWLAYVLVANLALNTPLGPRVLNGKPERFHADWGPAFTVWPGRFRIWEGQLNGQVGKILWNVQAGRIDAVVALGPLLHKEVRVVSAQARDVTGGVRPISPGQSALEPSPPHPGGLVLRFDAVSSDSVRALSLGPLVLEGLGRGEVAFSTQLGGGPLEIKPSTFHFEDGKVRVGKTVWLHDLVVDGAGSLPSHTRKQASGLAKLGLADVSVTAQASGMALQGRVLPKTGLQMQMGQGAGHLKADLRLKRGVLQPNTRVDATIPIHVQGISGPPLEEALKLVVSVAEDLRIQANVPAREQGQLRMDADLRVKGTQLKLPTPSELVARTSGHVVGRWQFPSMRWLPAMMGDPPWLQMQGGALAEFDLTLENGRPREGSWLSVEGVHATASVMGMRAQGAANVRGRFSTAANGRVQTGVQMDILEYGLAKVADGKAFATGRNLRVNVDANGLPKAVGGKVEALDARLTFDNAQLPDLRVYNQLLPRALRIDAGQGTAGADLRLDPMGGIAQGSVRVKSSSSRMQLLGLAVQGGFDIDAKLNRADLHSKRFVLDGTQIRLTDISATRERGGALQGWWLNAQLAQARIDLQKHTLQAQTSADMRDASLLLELFAQRKDYPRWIDRFIDAGRARGSARLAWEPSMLRIDQVNAGNDRYTILAAMRMRGDVLNGQMLGSMGPLSVGVGVRNGQRSFHLLRARNWYESQPAP